MSIHAEPFEGAGQTYKIGDADYRVEDWWDRVAGKSWMDSDGNPACIDYALRSAHAALPIDNEVVYGKVGRIGCLVHVSELGERAS